MLKVRWEYQKSTPGGDEIKQRAKRQENLCCQGLKRLMWTEVEGASERPQRSPDAILHAP